MICAISFSPENQPGLGMSAGMLQRCFYSTDAKVLRTFAYTFCMPDGCLVDGGHQVCDGKPDLNG